MKTLAYIIRVITLAPFMALIMFFVLYVNRPLFFGDTVTLALLVLFLVVLPLLAYPLQPLIKPYKDKGREGQRTLAIIFAVIGYVLGCIFALLLGASFNVLTIYLSYLISGTLVMLINKLFHFKASGHACGVTGPFTLLVYFGQSFGYFGFAFLAASWLASLYMKRHTSVQFIAGAAIPLAALGIVVLISAIL